MKSTIFFKMSVFLIIFACTSPQTKSEYYVWKNVKIVGGGFVDGIVFHPKEKGLCYARTDMGGAYRWNPEIKEWIPLLDWVSYEDNNLMGVESIALDPQNPDRVYLACGTYTNNNAPNGEILLSNNRGASFERIPMPFKMGGNENGRGNGERLMVDPTNGNIIYFGSRNDGLWRSIDAGHNWEQVNSFPVVTETPPDTLSERQRGMWQWSMKGSGIITVIFDPNTANDQGFQTIYVAYSLLNQNNLFRSMDGGTTWIPVPGHPQQYRPTHAILAEDGNLYITYGDLPGPFAMRNGGVWKLNTKTDEWKEITPDQPNHIDKKFGYAAVAVDAVNPQRIIVSSFYRPWNAGGDDIFRSTDGGETWTAIFANGTEFDYSIAPYVQYTGIHWMCDIEIDPFNPDHAIFTTGFGGFETFNLTNVDKGEPSKWSVYTNGIEETVPLQLCSPPEGAELITGIGDYAGFVHWNLNKAEEGQYFTDPYFGNCDDVTVAEKNPSLVVRVGIKHGSQDGSNIGYSTDFGKTWKPAGMPSERSGHGHIAVSADGSTWVWTPQRQQPWFTNDSGATWTPIDSLPRNIRVVADKVNPSKFYAVDVFEGQLYLSNDGAKSFTKQALNLANGIPERKSNRGDNRGGQDRIYATPGYENDLWLPAYDGLYHYNLHNQSFELQQNVTEIHAFGFGKEAPHSDYPALFLIGIVDGQRGIYRSDDMAKNWIRINDDQHQWGLLLHITGDPKKYGRVYVGSHGRGAIYGDPVQ